VDSTAAPLLRAPLRAGAQVVAARRATLVSPNVIPCWSPALSRLLQFFL